MIDFKKNLTEITIPQERAIYGLYQNGVLMYIGSTKNLRKRISHHTYEKCENTFTYFDSFSYTLIPDKKDMLSMEALEILKNKPKWNKILHSNPTWRSFDWFARKYFGGRVREFKKILMDLQIEAPYVFNSTPYFRITKLSKTLEDYLESKKTNQDIGF